MLPHRDTISSGLRFSKDHILSTVESSHALDTSESSSRAAVDPPPPLSFRTKELDEGKSLVQNSTESKLEEVEDSVPLVKSPSEPKESDSLSDRSMSEFYQLRNSLSLSTLMWTAVFFIPVRFFYDWNIALSFLLGAVAGLVYLRLLARNVERLGTNNQVGKSQIAVFIGVIIIATQVDSLQILPVFLGFLTYKVAILVYAFRTAVFNTQS